MTFCRSGRDAAGASSTVWVGIQLTGITSFVARRMRRMRGRPMRLGGACSNPAPSPTTRSRGRRRRGTHGGALRDRPCSRHGRTTRTSVSRKLQNSYAFIANAHLPEKVMLGRGCPRLADSSASFQAAAASLLS